MARNGRNRRNEPAYSDLTSEVSDNDGVGLVITDSDSSTGRSRKYVVSSRRSSDTWSSIKHKLKLDSLSRNEIICIVAGVLIFVAIVLLFIVIGAVTAANRSSSASNSTTTSPPATNPPQTTSPATNPPQTTLPQTTAQSTESPTEPVTSGPPMPWDNVRLPSSVVPDAYDVDLTVDLDTFGVTGSVSISCQVSEPIQFILVHAKEMDINGDSSSVFVGDTQVAFDGMFSDENEFYVLKLSETIEPGAVRVYLEFNYTLSIQLSGFYRSSYTDANGQTRYLATTQFEPTDARKAFPCFDEPALKAEFTMHITHHSDYTAVSNMPASYRSQLPNNMVTTHFNTSVKMSTYLVAFIVSDFECVRNTISDDRDQPLTIQVCSNPVIVDKTHYALEVASKVITFYEQEFNVTYPLPKQDLFAIPDFSAGAMENWGLITYRETAVLYDELTDPATSKQRVAVVIAHELAHQWFGNLVTMEWWDGLWLNEGFASFMEYIGTDHAEPSWNMLDQFFIEDLATALSLDSLNESHPILQTVSNPDEINSLFDSISYSKGGSVIRMIRNYLTEDNFKAGITSYLRSHEFGNAETYELWDSLQSQAPPDSGDVSEIMDTWTKQMGYPVLTVNRSSNTLTQTRFFAVQPAPGSSFIDSPYDYVWQVPFTYKYYSQGEIHPGSKLVTNVTTHVEWEVQSVTWIKGNVDQFGVYRVNYERDNWMSLIEYLHGRPNSQMLTPVDRAGLLDDAFALASSGLLETDVPFRLSKYLVGDTEYLPWQAALNWFSVFGMRLSLTPLYGAYSSFVRGLVNSQVERFSFADSALSHTQLFLRSSILHAAWTYGNDQVREEAAEIFQQWKTQNISVQPDLKTVVYSAGIASGDEDDWNFVWERYLSDPDPYEKRLLLRALAYSTEPWILSRYLTYAVEKVRSQDTLSVIVYVSRNVHGRYLAWNFVRNNWERINEMFGGGSFFGRVILYITSSFSTEFELQEVQDFFDRNPTGSGLRAYRQAIEIIQGNINWLKNNQDQLEDILTE